MDSDSPTTPAPAPPVPAQAPAPAPAPAPAVIPAPPALRAAERMPPGPGAEDPVVAATLAADRRRSRNVLLVGLLQLPAAIAVFALIDAASIETEGTPWDAILAFALVASFFGALFVAASHPLRTRDRRRIETDLRAPWELVQVFGAQVPRSPVGIVVVLRPDGTPIDQWIDETAAAARWPRDGERAWAWLAADPGGRGAVICAPDRNHLHRLVRTGDRGEAPEIHAWARHQVASAWRFADGDGMLVPAAQRVAGEAGMVSAAAVEQERSISGLRVAGLVLGTVALGTVTLGASQALATSDRQADYETAERVGRRSSVVVTGVLGGAADGERYLLVVGDDGQTIAVAGADAPIGMGDTVEVARGDGDLQLIHDELTHVVVGHVPDRPPWQAGRTWFAVTVVAFLALAHVTVKRRRIVARLAVRDG